MVLVRRSRLSATPSKVPVGEPARRDLLVEVRGELPAGSPLLAAPVAACCTSAHVRSKALWKSP